MREQFHARLDALGGQVASMGLLAADLLQDATRSLLAPDVIAADTVIGRSSELDRQRSNTEDMVVTLLALQAPVASDLRQVVSAMWILGDLHRMGTLAIHVATATKRRYPAEVIPTALRPVFLRMGQLGVDLAQQSAAALRDRDVALAGTLDAHDEEMDHLQGEVFAALAGPSWRYGVPTAVDVALLSRFYERFADHAVIVGRRVTFLVTGTNIGGDLARAPVHTAGPGSDRSA